MTMTGAGDRDTRRRRTKMNRTTPRRSYSHSFIAVPGRRPGPAGTSLSVICPTALCPCPFHGRSWYRSAGASPGASDERTGGRPRRRASREWCRCRGPIFGRPAWRCARGPVPRARVPTVEPRPQVERPAGQAMAGAIEHPMAPSSTAPRQGRQDDLERRLPDLLKPGARYRSTLDEARRWAGVGESVLDQGGHVRHSLSRLASHGRASAAPVTMTGQS